MDRALIKAVSCRENENSAWTPACFVFGRNDGDLVDTDASAIVGFRFTLRKSLYGVQ